MLLSEHDHVREAQESGVVRDHSGVCEQFEHLVFQGMALQKT